MENTRFIRAAAIWCAIGSLISLVFGVMDYTVPDLLSTPGIVIPRQLVLIAMHAMVLAGLVGLGLSGAVGSSAVGRIALGTALLGQALHIPAEALVIVDPKNTARILFAIGVVLTVLGMIATGIVVLRAKCWQGWHAFTPLLWGLYLVVVLPPAFAIGMLAIELAIAFWGICSLLLSVALWQEASRRQAVQPGFAS